MRMKMTTLLFLILCIQHLLMSQDYIPDSPATITIYCAGEKADVFDGRKFIGTTPLENISIEPGFHLLQYIPSGLNSWSLAALSESVFVAAGDSLHRNIELPAQLRIFSEPYGAAVMDGDSILSYTPAILWIQSDVKTLCLRKPGFDDMEILVTRSHPDIHAVLAQDAESNSVRQSMEIVKSSEKNNFPIYATASIAVVSGVVAAVCKIKADKYFDDYRATGNEGNISKIHSFDRISGISIAIEEVSLAALVYFLLQR
jgi:hypothetical protein